MDTAQPDLAEATPELWPRSRRPLAVRASTAARGPDDGVDLEVHLLGPFRLIRAGSPLETGNAAKSLRVLKYLLAHRERAVPKDVLVEIFWPDADVDTVGRNLHQAIYCLRRLLREGGPELDYVLFAGDAYLINPALSLWCDVEDFESWVAAARAADSDGKRHEASVAYASAERSYGGDFLADSPYEGWTVTERDRLRLRYVEVANRVADMYVEDDALDAAMDVSRRLLLHEPCDEGAHQRLIRCYGAAGRRNLVIRQYRSYVDCMERIFGLGPSPDMTELYESLLGSNAVPVRSSGGE